MSIFSRTHILKDVGMIVLSIGVAMFFLFTPSVERLLTVSMERELVVSFIAGIFFTSIITTLSAIVVLGELGGSISPWLIALVGGLGAVLGDLILFHFIRSHFNDDLEHFLRTKRIHSVFSFSRFRTFTWLFPFIGGLLIASPLPDELGVTLLGVTKLRTSIFIAVSYSSNFFGILLIAFIGKSLAS